MIYFQCHFFNVAPNPPTGQPIWAATGHLAFNGTATKPGNQWLFLKRECAASGCSVAVAQTCAERLPVGNVLMAGSYLFGGGSLASAELYNPVAGAFTPAGEMTTTRSLHTATLLNNGIVLVAGGSTYGGSTPLAGLYTPNVPAPAPGLFAVPGDGRVQGAIWHASSGEIASPETLASAREALSTYAASLSDGGLIPPQVAIVAGLAGLLPGELPYARRSWARGRGSCAFNVPRPPEQ